MLEGQDKDGSSFRVVARASGGEVRGLSIVCTTRGCGDLVGVVQEIFNSFEPFPGPAPLPAPPPIVSRPPADPRISESRASAR